MINWRPALAVNKTYKENKKDFTIFAPVECNIYNRYMFTVKIIKKCTLVRR